MFPSARLLLTSLATAALLCIPANGADDLSTAIRYYNEKDYDRAGEILRALQLTSPDNSEILYELGRVSRRQKKLDEAVNYLERATQLSPSNSEFHVALGDAYGALASKNRSFSLASKSRSALEKAVALDPKSERARAALIDYCREAPGIAGGGMSKAYANARELRQLDEPAGTRLLVPLLLSEKKAAEAAGVLIETLQKHPHDYSLNYLLGRIAATARTHEAEGIAALKKCLQLEPPAGFPGHAHARVRLGQLYVHKGNIPEARINFREALQLDPENGEAKTGLATLPESSP